MWTPNRSHRGADSTLDCGLGWSPGNVPPDVTMMLVRLNNAEARVDMVGSPDARRAMARWKPAVRDYIHQASGNPPYLIETSEAALKEDRLYREFIAVARTVVPKLTSEGNPDQDEA